MILTIVLERRRQRAGSLHDYIAELHRRVEDVELRLTRLFDAIESGALDSTEPALKGRIACLRAIRDWAKGDVLRAQAILDRAAINSITPLMVRGFVKTVRQRMLEEANGFRRGYAHALVWRIDVDTGQARLTGRAVHGRGAGNG